mgnify:CR=1 FL=1
MSEVHFELENGIEVIDRVTGVSGIITARCEYVNGCIRYSVSPKADKKTPTIIPDAWWIDEAQLEKIGDGLNKKPIAKKRTGGPTTKAPRF